MSKKYYLMNNQVYKSIGQLFGNYINDQVVELDLVDIL
jgi:hypothetical protein